MFCVNTCQTKAISPIRYTPPAHNHAITHCKITIQIAHFAPSSRLIDDTAATHGVYSKQNVKKLAALKGVIIP